MWSFNSFKHLSGLVMVLNLSVSPQLRWDKSWGWKSTPSNTVKFSLLNTSLPSCGEYTHLQYDCAVSTNYLHCHHPCCHPCHLPCCHRLLSPGRHWLIALAPCRRHKSVSTDGEGMEWGSQTVGRRISPWEIYVCLCEYLSRRQEVNKTPRWM